MDNSTAEAEPRGERGFWGLIGLQFQGAFSDNVFKQILILIVLARYAGDESSQGGWNALITAIFAMPYLLFAGWTGGLSDRFSKRHIILGTKVAEVAIMIIGGGILYYYSKSPTLTAFWMAMGILFLMATQSTFFSPSKYGILPEILSPRRLTFGNGILEMTTFLAIIFGVVIGNTLFDVFSVLRDDNPDSWASGITSMVFGSSVEELMNGEIPVFRLHYVSIALVGLAFVGMASGWFIQRVPAANPDLKIRVNHFPLLWKNIKLVLSDRILAMTVLGISYFWFLGAIVLANVSVWGNNYLGLSVVASGQLMAVMALGIGIGCMTVGWLSKKGVEIGFVPLGGLMITVFAFPLSLAHGTVLADGSIGIASIPMRAMMFTCLAMMGFGAGFYSVPLNALLQQRAPEDSRGGVIAALNFVNFSGIMVSSGLYWVLIKLLGFTSANIFAVISMITFFAVIMLIVTLPEVLLGFVSTVVTRFVYKIKVKDKVNIPREGPALLLCNHISMLDALIVASISPRPVRFIVWKEIFDSPILGYFLKIMKAIPISGDQRPRSVLASLSVASEALKNGELVCIFAEGQISRRGLTLPYRKGFRHVMGKAPVPIVPLYLHGVWGSIFSYERKQFVWQWPRRLRYPVQIAVGEAMAHDASMFEIRRRVQGLSADCALMNKSNVPPVHHRFIRNARKAPRNFCVADATRDPINFGRALMGGIILARRLRKVWGDQEMVGIYLPPTVGGVLVNVAASISGRTSVNLNYTTGPDILNHCIEQCELKTVVTSKVFLKKLGSEAPPGAVIIEDIMKEKPKITEIVGGLLASRLLPIRLLEKYCGAARHPGPDDLATIIFSSGSTGVPKGIMLSHFNIASNIASFDDAVSLWSDDIIMGFLPFFHSFGFTATLWGGLSIGFGVVHHPNPLEAKVIGDLVQKYKMTVMIGTPTFLQTYIRRVESEKFKTLEFILTGAEKLPERVVKGFREKFGHTVHEGYGTTECAPVVSVNVDEYRNKGIAHRVGNRPGSVGHPVPGVVVRIVDVDTGEQLGAEERGMIHVRGPNIMQGYYGQPERTAKVMMGEWYETGDMGYLDEDGFLHITGRLARFSKIGGEMVPHMKVEEMLHQVLELQDLSFAVAGVPDQSKGERLVVLHTLEDDALEGISERLAEQGIPNLWAPRRRDYFHVDHIPILGTGKMDLAAVSATARELAGGGVAPTSSAPAPPTPTADEPPPAKEAGATDEGNGASTIPPPEPVLDRDESE